MNFVGILAKLLGKPKAQIVGPSGWGDWLDTPDGKRWEVTGEKVYDQLETARINVTARRFLVRDDTRTRRLTFNQAVRRVIDETGEDAKAVREHVMLWMEEAADPEDGERDEDIDDAIQLWLEDIRQSRQLTD